MKGWIIQTGTGRLDLTAEVSQIGRDLLIAVYGGDKPHVGAVAVAQPRPSLKDPEQNSASVSVICCMGHKEDMLARNAAQEISARMKSTVVVTAGMHWTELTEKEITIVEEKMKDLIGMLCEQLGCS